MSQQLILRVTDGVLSDIKKEIYKNKDLKNQTPVLVEIEPDLTQPSRKI